MKCIIGTPAVSSGLLLVLAMVCASFAQAPAPLTDAPPFTPAPSGAKGSPPPAPSSTRPVEPTRVRGPITISAPASEMDEGLKRLVGVNAASGLVALQFQLDPQNNPQPSVGRCQAVSHNGKLLLLDTATGECWEHETNSWHTIAPPVNQPKQAVDVGPATALPMAIPTIRAETIINGIDGERPK
jgi:hypothetical protein